jgi:hypothetical protein
MLYRGLLYVQYTSFPSYIDASALTLTKFILFTQETFGKKMVIHLLPFSFLVPLRTQLDLYSRPWNL